jgi:hypothetical protein
MLKRDLYPGAFYLYDFVYNGKQYLLLSQIVSSYRCKATIIVLSKDGTSRRKTIAHIRCLKPLSPHHKKLLDSLEWNAIFMHEKAALDKMELIENVETKLKLNSVFERIEVEEMAAKAAGRKPDFSRPDMFVPSHYVAPYALHGR